MFFPEKIVSIRPLDKVLEIGPGATPHARSNAFLELAFDTSGDKIAQRGGITEDAFFGGRPVYYYDGTNFPFETGQFDYVICSHVIEHVVNPVSFLEEIFRVAGGRGYIEYPLLTYEYLYDFKVHLHFVKFDAKERKLQFLPKSKTGFQEFSDVSLFFNQMLVQGWDDLCAANKHLFFEGFEFIHPFAIQETTCVTALLPELTAISPKTGLRKLLGQVINRVGL